MLAGRRGRSLTNRSQTPTLPARTGCCLRTSLRWWVIKTSLPTARPTTGFSSGSRSEEKDGRLLLVRHAQGASEQPVARDHPIGVIAWNLPAPELATRAFDNQTARCDVPQPDAPL